MCATHMAPNESHPSHKAVELPPPLPANYLYYPANLSPNKGHDKLLKAFSRIMQSDDFIPLALTGYETDILQDLEKCASHENRYINEPTNIIINSGMVHGKHYYSLGYLADNEIQAVFSFCSTLVTVSSAEKAWGCLPMKLSNWGNRFAFLILRYFESITPYELVDHFGLIHYPRHQFIKGFATCATYLIIILAAIALASLLPIHGMILQSAPRSTFVNV